jgi:hypothetical protein
VSASNQAAPRREGRGRRIVQEGSSGEGEIQVTPGHAAGARGAGGNGANPCAAGSQTPPSCCSPRPCAAALSSSSACTLFSMSRATCSGLASPFWARRPLAGARAERPTPRGSNFPAVRGAEEKPAPRLLVMGRACRGRARMYTGGACGGAHYKQVQAAYCSDWKVKRPVWHTHATYPRHSPGCCQMTRWLSPAARRPRCQELRRWAQRRTAACQGTLPTC